MEDQFWAPIEMHLRNLAGLYNLSESSIVDAASMMRHAPKQRLSLLTDEQRIRNFALGYIYQCSENDVRIQILLDISENIRNPLKRNYPLGDEDITDIVRDSATRMLCINYDPNISSIKSYVYKFAVFAARNYSRLKYISLEDVPGDYLAEEKYCPDLTYIDATQLLLKDSLLIEAIESIPKRQRQALMLSIAGESTELISRDMGISEVAVRSNLMRAYKTIRHILAGSLAPTVISELPPKAEEESCDFRELVVMQALANGKSRKAICKLLRCSLHNVNAICRSIIRKMKETDITRAVIKAYATGLIV